MITEEVVENQAPIVDRGCKACCIDPSPRNAYGVDDPELPHQFHGFQIEENPGLLRTDEPPRVRAFIRLQDNQQITPRTPSALQLSIH